MNNIFAVTADLKRCSIAIQFENSLFELNENLEAPTYLVTLAQQLCEKNKIELEKIDRIITASGPGSFTGIRTAQSFAKGLSLALNIPATCTSYFQVIKNLYGHGNDLVAIMRSEKNQVYFFDFATENFGVSSYDSLDEKLSPRLPLVGEKIDEVLKNYDREFFEIENYKDAKNFISLTEFDLHVAPLYINAQQH